MPEHRGTDPEPLGVILQLASFSPLAHDQKLRVREATRDYAMNA
jgi:hypothetical protein